MQVGWHFWHTLLTGSNYKNLPAKQTIEFASLHTKFTAGLEKYDLYYNSVIYGWALALFSLGMHKFPSIYNKNYCYYYYLLKIPSAGKAVDAIIFAAYKSYASHPNDLSSTPVVRILSPLQ